MHAIYELSKINVNRYEFKLTMTQDENTLKLLGRNIFDYHKIN